MVNTRRVTALFLALTLGPAFGLAESKKSKAASHGTAAAAVPTAAIDLNTASEAELDKLPGVGPATAKKIIANRPYSSAADLRKAGVASKTIDKIAPLVTASGGTAAPTPTPGRSAKPVPNGIPTSSATGQNAPSSPTAGQAPAASNAGVRASRANSPTAQTVPAGTPPPRPGMVWANKETKVFHRAGDRWYGQTKNGVWMTEQDAMKAGFRESKEK